jgi:hypothetical protein
VSSEDSPIKIPTVTNKRRKLDATGKFKTEAKSKPQTNIEIKESAVTVIESRCYYTIISEEEALLYFHAQDLSTEVICIEQVEDLKVSIKLSKQLSSTEHLTILRVLAGITTEPIKKISKIPAVFNSKLHGLAKVYSLVTMKDLSLIKKKQTVKKNYLVMWEKQSSK